MTLLMLFAAAMIPLSIGVIAGWVAHVAIVDPDQAGDIEAGRGRAERVIELAMQRHLPIKFPDTDPYHPGEVMCLCLGPDGPTDALIFAGPVYHRRHVAATAVDMLTSTDPIEAAASEREAQIIDFPERPGA